MGFVDSSRLPMLGNDRRLRLAFELVVGITIRDNLTPQHHHAGNHPLEER